MRRRSLIWHLFPSYLLVVMASLLAVMGYTAQSVRQFYLEQTASDLEARAALLSPQIQLGLAADAPDELQSLCETLGASADTRITVVVPSGDVIADSEESPATMDNHAARPEIRQALAGETGSSIRFSQTLQERMMYVAAPLQSDGTIQGVLRVAIPITAIQETLWSLITRIVYAGVFVALLGAGVSWIVSRRITKPLAELQIGAERIAQGDLHHPLRPQHSHEIATLATTMNTMATELGVRIQNAERSRNEREAVLASMVEGVIAVDSQERLIMINDAAAKIFGLQSEEVLGRALSETIRISAFQEFARKALSSTDVVEEEMLIHTTDEHAYQVHGSVLAGSSGNGRGAVIVLNDVTRLRQLERIRRDFVSNVSHELRTPITSVKGFVETLLDTAPEDPEEVRRFLKIIEKHTNQLDTLINDLLTISRIEQGDLNAHELLEEGRIGTVIEEAIEACEHLARARNVRVKPTFDSSSLRACPNPSLLQQAVVNLLDNAIKYSDPAGEVEISSADDNDDIAIIVRDHGCGISPQHLPRLFERFYRVDKARSRELGGTGLGLAIVKHIVELHGGSVDVESRLGVGSTFTIRLPLA